METLLELLGLALIAAAAGIVAIPAGVAVAGVECIVVAARMAKAKRR